MISRTDPVISMVFLTAQKYCFSSNKYHNVLLKKYKRPIFSKHLKSDRGGGTCQMGVFGFTGILPE